MALLHRQLGTPNDQPGASSRTSASFDAPASRTFMRTSLKVAGPLLVVGACTAVAMTASGSGSSANLTTQVKTNSADTNQVSHSTSSNPPADQPAAAPNSGAPTTRSSYSVSNNGSSAAQVTVNGQAITVPPNSSVQQSYTSPDGNSSLSVSTSNQSSADNSSSSSTSTSVNISTDSWSDDSGSSATYTQEAPMP